jgi:hypothetical protein
MAQVTGPTAPVAYTLSASSGDSFDDGNRYFEVRIDALVGATSSISIGFADSDLDPSGNELGGWSWGYAWRADGHSVNNGVATPLGTAAVVGDIVQLAVSAYNDGGLAKANIWFGLNGSWFDGGNPESNLNPAFSEAIAASATDWGVRATLRTNGDRLIANFGGSPFVYPIPNGFSSGWGIGIV